MMELIPIIQLGFAYFFPVYVIQNHLTRKFSFSRENKFMEFNSFSCKTSKLQPNFSISMESKDYLPIMF